MGGAAATGGACTGSLAVQYFSMKIRSIEGQMGLDGMEGRLWKEQRAVMRAGNPKALLALAGSTGWRVGSRSTN